MDSEELHETNHKIATNTPITRENPYKVDAVWAGYKNSVIGTLAGLFIGAGVGAAIGAIAAAGIGLALGGISLATGGAIVAGASIFGMLHGADKFERIGIAAGTAASVEHKSEERMKEYERSIFLELKREIRELKAAITGKKEKTSLSDVAQEKTLVDAVEQKQQDFRVEHCDDSHCPPNGRKLYFARVGAVGAAAGAAAGALLGFGGAAESVLPHIIGEGLHIGAAEAGLAMMIAGGAVGASFGINRDIFRKIYDHVAEPGFLGTLGNGHGKAQSPEPAKTQVTQTAPQKPEIRLTGPSQQPFFVEFIHPEHADRSDTFYQDREKMKKMLLAYNPDSRLPN